LLQMYEYGASKLYASCDEKETGGKFPAGG